MATITPAPPAETSGIPKTSTNDIEKITPGHDNAHEVLDDLKVETDEESAHKQDGVKQVEAITTAWSKNLLWTMFILLYLVTFVDMLLQSVQTNLTVYVTSAFSQQGLLATTSIVASVLGGVSKLTIAKIIDIWGRCEGFLFMLLLIVIGIIMKATCKNVEMYAAAHTLYWVGHLGIGYIIDVMLADMTTLRNRMIMFGVNATPTIATTFAGPRIADLFYTHSNFRWAFGTFCIIMVVICLPVGAIFIYSQRKAQKFGLTPEKASTRTPWEACKYYFVEFDVIGMLLTTLGWSLLLLPFNLAKSAPKGWASGYIIAMIVLGVASLAAFVIWERNFAPVAYIPLKFLKDRTILGACLLYGIMFISIYCWDDYYSSYLQVVHNLSITDAGYVLNSFSLMSSFLGPFIGLIIRYTGNYKWTALAGIPFCVLGTALLIHFRTSDSQVGYLVMCQLFNGISSGIWAITAHIAIMASVTHQEIAVVLALFGLFGSVGAAIGVAIAGAIWTNVLPGQLYNDLPEGSKNLTKTIYGSIVKQKAYPMGSPIRTAIIEAYSNVQRRMVIAGSAFIPFLLICILLWRNVNVKKLDLEKRQTKGNVW